MEETKIYHYSEIKSDLFVCEKRKVEFLFKLITHPHIHNGKICLLSPNSKEAYLATYDSGFMKNEKGDIFNTKKMPESYEDIYNEWINDNKPYILVTLSADTENKRKISILENRMFIDLAKTDELYETKQNISEGGFNASIHFSNEELIEYFYQIVNEVCNTMMN